MTEIKTVAVCSRSFSRNSKLKSLLDSQFQDVKYNVEGSLLKSESLVKFLQGYDAAIIGLEVIDEEVLSKLPQLKVIGKYGVGLDQIDLDACERYGVRIGWTPGVNAKGVAELALNLALSIVRKTAISQKKADDGCWEQVIGRQLSSLTIGILGCGHVGEAFLALLSGFNCEVLVFDKEDKTEICNKYGATQVELNSVLSKSDLVSIHLPKTPDTLELLKEDMLELLKPGSYIVNTARGGLVSESYLIKALESSALAGAALDVLENEPDVNRKLISAPNCIVTTHIGGSSVEAILEMGIAAINGLKNNLPAIELIKYK